MRIISAIEDTIVQLDQQAAMRIDARLELSEVSQAQQARMIAVSVLLVTIAPIRQLNLFHALLAFIVVLLLKFRFLVPLVRSVLLKVSENKVNVHHAMQADIVHRKV